MRFEETGLPKNEVVEKAFDTSYRNFDMRRREQFQSVEKQFEKTARAQAKKFMDNPTVSDAEKKAMMVELERQIKFQKENLKAQANREISNGFKDYILKPAQTLHSILGAGASDTKLAAVMLFEMANAPDDFAVLKAEFSEDIVNIVTSIQDLEINYGHDLSEGISKMNNDSKSVYLAMVIGDMNSLSEQAAKLQPGQQLQLMGGEEQMSGFARNAAAAKGAEPKLDTAFVKAFNTLSHHIDAGMEIRDNTAKNKYEMKRTEKKAPNSAFNGAANGSPQPQESPQFFIMYDPDGPVVGKKPEVRFTFTPARPPGM